MAFLPEELSRTKERTCRLLPAHNAAPLIVNLGKISVGMNNIPVKIAEKSLRCGTHAELFLKRLKSALSYPCNLGCEALDMVLLFLKKRLGDEHGHINILNARFFKPLVELLLDELPDSISGGLDDHTSLNRRIVCKFRLDNDVCIPLREILTHRGDRFNLLLFLFHRLFLFISFDMYCINAYACARSISALSSFSHGKSRSVRPKWPYAAVCL